MSLWVWMQTVAEATSLLKKTPKGGNGSFEISKLRKGESIPGGRMRPEG